ncbi:hypothetical protein AAA799B03_00776 [Marine Group I thaumarchaeote SCGC AAA799-B03]|uniref:Cyclase-dehydrase protein n=4 Tax=Marine Group I TaxID=905826 RepID=A0A087S7B7_9ARCH|nr:hypothetical protein AAA799N04_00245 [Marine Group I thaumarchaeote SCGC AAA799-N04]KFM16012.1 hypothetical protein AAA799D11_00801 [Marine Group I thaumarchaeote SCGC AAA799-D11]KFM17749.1 hypothetical protein SCCGRSA3_01679 [Marine Group I thaumarchaeote SCGC RSA3]KFM21621.1 hypothetical protein AAA799B03_00776 [Marine Group I thaumarchaeote SCGC AAA799-B03]
MKQFTLERFSKLSQPDIFQISIDVENFHNIMPDYFKSLDVLEENKYGMIVNEKIHFLGIPTQIKTKHIIIHPNIHGIHILAGPLKGTSFIESYVEKDNGTMITIDVTLHFNNFFKLFPFLQNLVVKKMSKTMDEFVRCTEKSYPMISS